MGPSREPGRNWEQFKDVIYHLYITKEFYLNQVREEMETKHNLKATISMYRTQVEKWGFRKYLKDGARGKGNLGLLAQQYVAARRNGNLYFQGSLSKPVSPRTLRRRGVLPALLESHPEVYTDIPPTPSQFFSLVEINFELTSAERTLFTPSQLLNFSCLRPISQPFENISSANGDKMQITSRYKHAQSARFCVRLQRNIPSGYRVQSKTSRLVPDTFTLSSLDPSTRLFLETAFRLAIMGHDFPVIDFLHARGIGVHQVWRMNHCIPISLTAFEYACACGYLDLAVHLLEIGYPVQTHIPINSLVLAIAGWTQRTTGIETEGRDADWLVLFLLQLLDRGAEIDAPGLASTSLNASAQPRIYWHTPLTAASASCNTTLVRSLLERGANVDKVTPSGLTALAACLLAFPAQRSSDLGYDNSQCESSVIRTVTALLEAGADPNATIPCLYIKDRIGLRETNLLHLVAPCKKLTEVLRWYGARPLAYPADFFRAKSGVVLDRYFDLMIEGDVPVSDELLCFTVEKYEEGDSRWLQRIINTRALALPDKVKLLSRAIKFSDDGDVVEQLILQHLTIHEPQARSTYVRHETEVAELFQAACPRLSLQGLERINGGVLQAYGSGERVDIEIPGIRRGHLTHVALDTLPKMTGEVIHGSVVRGNFAMAEYLSSSLGLNINIITADCDTALNAAIRMGNAELVKSFLDSGAEQVMRAGGSCSCGADLYANALVAAAETGNSEFVKVFVSSRMHVLTIDLNERPGRLAHSELLREHQDHFCGCVSPLTAAILGGHYALVEFLMNLGASPNGKPVTILGQHTLHPVSPLAAAIISNRLDIAQWLLNKGASPVDSKAIAVIKMNLMLEFVQLLATHLRHGRSDPKSRAGALLLDTALRNFPRANGDLVPQARMVLQSLLTSNIAPINGNHKFNGNPPSPIYRALCQGLWALLPLFVDSGADCNSLLWYQDTQQSHRGLKATSVLRMAVEQNCDLHWVEFLLGVGAKDIQIPGIDNQLSVVELSEKKGNLRLKKLLLTRSLGLDFCPKPHRTALQQAVIDRDLHTVDLLFRYGIKENIHKWTLEEPQTPLELAVISDNLQIVEYLLQNGADANEREFYSEDNTSFTALQLAAKVGYVDIARILLRYHANADIKRVPAWDRPMDAAGEVFLSPLELAELYRRKEVKELLIEWQTRVGSIWSNMGFWFGN
ncbi:ankyrin repeat-containing domain protein [Podospora fimiseda]|uniref:Ankyrin repeat-containing domain protein n=1 Tax=Podospora fimiseda TaxID=252190 RepID=A0AAN7BGJ5_9PEZI|nr:ankyrin repeat-containing domain protein [Podospora fimiseda]